MASYQLCRHRSRGRARRRENGDDTATMNHGAGLASMLHAVEEVSEASGCVGARHTLGTSSDRLIGFVALPAGSTLAGQAVRCRYEIGDQRGPSSESHVCPTRRNAAGGVRVHGTVLELEVEAQPVRPLERLT